MFLQHYEKDSYSFPNIKDSQFCSLYLSVEKFKKPRGRDFNDTLDLKSLGEFMQINQDKDLQMGQGSSA